MNNRSTFANPPWNSSLHVASQVDGFGVERLWFTKHFIAHTASGNNVGTPICTWERNGDKVTQTFGSLAELIAAGVSQENQLENAGKQRIWILKNVYNADGERLGVWPD